jgi:hypothetical protein
VLAPVLDEYAVGFRVMHGFSSATVVNDIAQDGDGREVIARRGFRRHYTPLIVSDLVGSRGGGF